MKLTHVSLYANDVEALTFSLRPGRTDSKFQVRQILGLDADDLIPRFYGFGHELGVDPPRRFYDFGMNPREIVVRVTLNPRFELDESYSDIRDEMLRAISASRTGEVTLLFNYVGTNVAKIDGFITKFEVPHWTALPEVQMTIRCEDPVLRGANPIRYENMDPAFTASGSGVGQLVMGDNLSTAPHGLTMQVTIGVETGTITIQDAELDTDWKMIIGAPIVGLEDAFQIGDILTISSESKIKAAYVERAGSTYNLLDKIHAGSQWPIIFPGFNEFWVPQAASLDFNYVEYYPAYWGI